MYQMSFCRRCEEKASRLLGIGFCYLSTMPSVRRLHYECEVIMTSTIRSTVETPDTATPKAIPFAEKTARMDQMRQRFQDLRTNKMHESRDRDVFRLL